MSGHSKWANIKHKKAKVDAQKGKAFTKLGKEILIAAKQGGGDPEGNLRLKNAVQKAKEANMPNDNINRLIQRAVGGGDNVNYEEITYEGYGPAGVAVLLEIATDNRNRTASEIRYIFSRNGGNLGETGCVAWMFNTKGVITFDTEGTDLDPDELMLEAIEAGAEDVDIGVDAIEVVTAPETLETVKEQLVQKGFRYQSAEVTKVPQTSITLSDVPKAEQMLRLVEALEDNDDVQNVYANFDIFDQVMDQMND